MSLIKNLLNGLKNIHNLKVQIYFFFLISYEIYLLILYNIQNKGGSMNEINKRLDEILESSIIIDTLSHGPLVWSDDILKANDEMLAQNMNPWDIIPILILQYRGRC